MCVDVTRLTHKSTLWTWPFPSFFAMGQARDDSVDRSRNSQNRLFWLVVSFCFFFTENNDWGQEETMSGLTFLGFVGIDETVRKQVSRHVHCFLSIICKV